MFRKKSAAGLSAALQAAGDTGISPGDLLTASGMGSFRLTTVLARLAQRGAVAWASEGMIAVTPGCDITAALAAIGEKT